jgi:D-inositol-3-phosphate glycosyltransferase
VSFAGRCTRGTLRMYYAAADVHVTTPSYEPFGLTPLEAMACGTPVIGSAVGGVRQSVIDGETGVLVPPGDAPALAAQLQRLHDDPTLARAMGHAGQRRVRSRYTWERVMHELVDVYHGVRHGGEADALPIWRRLRLVRPGQSLAWQVTRCKAVNLR